MKSTIHYPIGLSSNKLRLSPIFSEDVDLNYPYNLIIFCNEDVAEETNSCLTRALSKPEFKLSTRTKKQ